MERHRPEICRYPNHLHDTEKSNWTWDPEAGQFYWHRFFSHQPGSQFRQSSRGQRDRPGHEALVDAGVDGFRLDAIPYLCERDGTNNENLPETHTISAPLRAELDAYAKGKVLLAEAKPGPEDVQEYFGQGNECHMAYHFPADAADLHGDCPGRSFPDHGHFASDAGYPKQLPVGAVSAQPR